MKKIVMIIMAGLLLVSAAFASDVNETSVEVEDDEFSDRAFERAIIKLEQLDLSVQKHILSSEFVLEQVPENISNETLVSLVNDFESLHEQIVTIIGSAQMYNVTELNVEFELFKEQAVNITNEFRKEAQDIIPREAQDSLREKVKNNRHDFIEQKRSEIREKIREHNAGQVRMFLQKIGLVNDSLAEQVENGSLNTGQAISSIAREFKGLGKMKQGEFRSELNERRVRAQIHKQQIEERVENRMNERSESSSENNSRGPMR